MPNARINKINNEWHGVTFIGKPRLRLIGLPLLVHLSRFQLHLGFQNHQSQTARQYQSACGVSNTEDLAACCKMLPILRENTWVTWGSRKDHTKSKFSHKFLKHLHTWWMLSSSLSPLKSDMATENPKQGRAFQKIQKQDGETPSQSGVTRGDGTKDCFNWL